MKTVFSGRFNQSRDEVNQSGFAASGSSHEGNRLARRYGQVDITQYRFIVRTIAETSGCETQSRRQSAFAASLPAASADCRLDRQYRVHSL